MTDSRTEEAQPAAITRAATLRMGRAWQSLGLVNQAIDAYSRILARYPGSPEAREARDNILALAQAYERQGRFHRAMGLYEKLEELA